MSKTKLVILLTVVPLVIFLDQWTKILADTYLHRPVNLCTSQRIQCEKRCLHRPPGETMASCKQSCQRKAHACRLHYEVERQKWPDRLRQLKESFWCKRVRHYWSGVDPECVVVEGFFHLIYRTNEGAAWGFLSTHPRSFRRPFFLSITVLAIIFILYFFYRVDSSQWLILFALALIFGGALGNFIDRLRLEYVIDFIEWFIKYKGKIYRWPTFNIADVAITCGVAFLAIEMFLFTEEPRPFQKERGGASESPEESAKEGGKEDVKEGGKEDEESRTGAGFSLTGEGGSLSGGGQGSLSVEEEKRQHRASSGEGLQAEGQGTSPEERAEPSSSREGGEEQGASPGEESEPSLEQALEESIAALESPLAWEQKQDDSEGRAKKK